MLTWNEMGEARAFMAAYEGRSYLNHPPRHIFDPSEEGISIERKESGELEFIIHPALRVEPVSEHYWIDLLKG